MDANERHIRRCIELSTKSLADGDWPFGAILVDDDETVIAEATNTAKRGDLTGHAEVNVIRKALAENNGLDLSSCTLYSNFEPCPMCSFIIREHGIGKVVYSLSSPHWGCASRWSVLIDEISPNAFANVPKGHHPPTIIRGVLKQEAGRVFDSLGWTSYKDPPQSRS